MCTKIIFLARKVIRKRMLLRKVYFQYFTLPINSIIFIEYIIEYYIKIFPSIMASINLMTECKYAIFTLDVPLVEDILILIKDPQKPNSQETR